MNEQTIEGVPIDSSISLILFIVLTFTYDGLQTDVQREANMNLYLINTTHARALMRYEN